MKKKLADKKHCSGCTACQSICPANAITMKSDSLGFKYPIVNLRKCNGCNLCKNVCAFKPYDSDDILPELDVYLARLLNLDELLHSRSGGAFTALAQYFLHNGGVVYGAAINEDFTVSHRRAKNREQFEPLRGTKYVESDLQGVFFSVKEDLENGNKVFFSGLPCQVVGLKSFIKAQKNNLTENLYTVDLLCHGVPAPYIWRDYLKSKRKKFKQKPVSVSFRDKSYGWRACKNTFYFADGSHVAFEDYSGFMYHLWIFLRMCCEVCPFTSVKRPGDLTIGDSWEQYQVSSTFNTDDKGGSMIMVNTEKGRELYNAAEPLLFSINATVKNSLQPVMDHPTPFHRKRRHFERDYAIWGYAFVRERYLKKDCDKIYKKLYRKVDGRIMKMFNVVHMTGGGYIKFKSFVKKIFKHMFGG